MEKNRYTVALRYDPQDTEIHQRVVARLARIDPDAVQKFKRSAFTGRLILKRNADPTTAGRLKQLFSATGAVCDIRAESETPGAGLSTGKRPSHPPMIQCPNCGCEQPGAPECRSCGIIIAKAGRPRPHRTAEDPAATTPSGPPPRNKPSHLRRWIRAASALVEKIEHPIDVRKLTTWSKRVADRLIRCAIVFTIALALEIGLLAMGKMLWSLYTATAMGQYYIERLPEQAQVFSAVAQADPLSLGLDTTIVVLCVSLLVACAAQILHLPRYLYESQGFIGKLLLWFIPCTGLTAWVISQRYPYPELPLAGTITAVPTLCILSSCLYLARILLPEVGDLRVIISIIRDNRSAAWENIIEKIRIWFDTTKRV
jgi:hypothetical protein